MTGTDWREAGESQNLWPQGEAEHSLNVYLQLCAGSPCSWRQILESKQSPDVHLTKCLPISGFFLVLYAIIFCNFPFAFYLLN